MSRIKTRKWRGRTVAAELGTCCRCRQTIYPNQRVVNESGKFPAHRDCVRLHIAMPRPTQPQVSKGWGSHCANCGGLIDKPQPWRMVGTETVHQTC